MTHPQSARNIVPTPINRNQFIFNPRQHVFKFQGKLPIASTINKTVEAVSPVPTVKFQSISLEKISISFLTFLKSYFNQSSCSEFRERYVLSRSWNHFICFVLKKFQHSSTFDTVLHHCSNRRWVFSFFFVFFNQFPIRFKCWHFCGLLQASPYLSPTLWIKLKSKLLSEFQRPLNAG